MPYGEFSIEEVKARFQLRIAEAEEYFAGIPPVEVSDFLARMLAENIPLAVAVSTEKARSELIIAPVLLEARRQVQRRVSLFSGVEFTVDPSQGLNGTCDYLLSLSPEQLTIEAPVVTVVEAKNDNLKSGLGQCMAEMGCCPLVQSSERTRVPAGLRRRNNRQPLEVHAARGRCSFSGSPRVSDFRGGACGWDLGQYASPPKRGQSKCNR